MKRCSKCDVEKPLEDFAKANRSSDGRASCCKTCHNASARQTYQRDLDHSRSQKRAYAAANREAVNARSAERSRRARQANPERARQQATEKSRKFREVNPDYHREWYQANIDKERERLRLDMRRRRQANPAAEKERKRRYRAKNLAAVTKREREKTYARRVRQPYSPELAQIMAQLVQEPCTYCGSSENMTIDHIVPLSRGGKHEASNLAPACFSCNSSKCDRLLSEWAGRLAA